MPPRRSRPRVRSRRPRPAGDGVPSRSAVPSGSVAYVDRTRDASVNVLFLVPWVLVYLLCWWTVGAEVENQVAASLGSFLQTLGRTGRLLLALGVIVGLSAFLWARWHTPRPSDAGVLSGMLVEGIVYGLLLQGTAWALSRLFPVGQWLGIGLYHWPRHLSEVRVLGIAVGAGIFEELLFRGVVCLGLYHLLRASLPTHRAVAGVVAVVLAAYLFSAYHHWGAGGEPWDAVRFTFRFHAGVFLGAVFLTRGLGIAAFAHGLYDVMVLLA